jgi:hypothetical protein
MPSIAPAAPFGWTSIRLDPDAVAALARTVSTPQLVPGGDPVEGAHVHFIATGGAGETVTEGFIVRVLSTDQAVAELVFVSDELCRAQMPLLVMLRREHGKWSITAWERTFARSAEDPLLEELRRERVTVRLAHLRQKADRIAVPGSFFAMVDGSKLPEIRAQIEEIETWLRETGRG